MPNIGILLTDQKCLLLIPFITTLVTLRVAALVTLRVAALVIATLVIASLAVAVLIVLGRIANKAFANLLNTFNAYIYFVAANHIGCGGIFFHGEGFGVCFRPAAVVILGYGYGQSTFLICFLDGGCRSYYFVYLF